MLIPIGIAVQSDLPVTLVWQRFNPSSDFRKVLRVARIDLLSGGILMVGVVVFMFLKKSKTDLEEE